MVMFCSLATTFAALITCDNRKTNYNNFCYHNIITMTSATTASTTTVLFLAVRMRVTWLTQGKGDPPVWMQVWMYCTTYAILATRPCSAVRFSVFPPAILLLPFPEKL